MKKRNIFLEDIAYGIYDKPGPMGSVAELDKEPEDTVPDSAPIMPTNQMASQLSVERPPVEDEDYVPGNIEELSKSASAIARMVPQGQLEFFYRQLHKLLDDSTDRAGEELDSKEVSESRSKKMIKNVLKEMLSDEDKREFDKYRTGGVDYFGDSEPETEDNEGMSLEDLAAKFGYSGAPGVRQEIDKITNRLEYFVQKVSEEDLNALMEYAVGEYVDTLLKGDFIEEEDARDLQKSPDMVKGLDSFRFFFVGTFVLPAYREVVREATKKLKKEISDLGIPDALHQTVFNQVTGASSKKPEVILKRLKKLIDSGEIKEQDIPEIARKISSALPALKASVEYSDDLVQRSLDKWQSTSKGLRLKAIKQALEKTSEG
jgi:hypothetical protein